jgi:hypothetical protein
LADVAQGNGEVVFQHGGVGYRPVYPFEGKRLRIFLVIANQPSSLRGRYDRSNLKTSRFVLAL